ncbi:hypothetical protein [Micromonospora sp. WMMD736]|uniref:hypothetical protein n=1 Tax=Micromonospora sp. WMMD736 TaxID=3404112 RepID=UPI003B954984
MATLPAVEPDNLNALMDFGHVIRVHPDGTVSEPHDVWAPELNDDVLGEFAHIEGQPTGWRLMNGYSGQWSYRGPVMHESESIGGRMALDILGQPGLYVSLLASTSEPVEDCEHCRAAGEGGPCDLHDITGWAVAYIEDEDEIQL